MTEDIRALLEELRNVPNRLGFELGDHVYQLLCEQIEPIIGKMEDEIKWMEETMMKMGE